MERQIKFRAWDNEISQYRIPGQIQLTSGGKTFILVPFNSGLKHEIINDIVIEQYTGLKDKQGVEIYEGDIVSYDATPYNVNGLKAKGVIAMIKNSWALKYKSKWGDSSGYGYYNLGCEDFFHKKSEIIGNIHSNPELLNK